MKDDLLKNSLIVGTGRVFAQFTSLLLVPLYTLFLSPEEYGLGDIIITYAALALPFMTLGLEQGAFRFLVDARKDEKRKKIITTFLVRSVLTLGVALSFLVFIIGHVLSFDLINLVSFFLMSSALFSASLWYVRGLGQNTVYAVASIIAGATTLLAAILFVPVLKFGVEGMILALMLANVLGCVYIISRTKMYKYVDFRVREKQIEKEMLGYSLPLVPNSISWWLVSAVDRSLIAVLLGVAASGIYGVAIKFPAILIGLFSIFWISWHESASVNINHKNRDEFFSRVTNSTIALFSCIGLVILVTLSVFFDYIVGTSFQEAYLYIPILMLGALGSSIVTMYGSVYAAKKKTRQILNTTIVAGVVNVAVVLVTLPILGLFGAAIASVLAYVSMVIYRHYDIRKYVKVSINWKKLAPVILLSIISVALYYVNDPTMNVVNLLFVVVLSVYINKGVVLSTKDVLWQKLQKF